MASVGILVVIIGFVRLRCLLASPRGRPVDPARTFPYEKRRPELNVVLFCFSVLSGVEEFENLASSCGESWPARA